MTIEDWQMAEHWANRSPIGVRTGPGKKSPKKGMTSEEYLQFVEDMFADMVTLIKAKNADYTVGGGPFSNFEDSTVFGVDPFVGLLLRFQDKWKRVQSYVKLGELKVENEGIEDAFKDIIGYACLALGMLKERQAILIDSPDAGTGPKRKVPI